MNIKKWHIAGFFFVLIAGTLLHFTYDWSDQNQFVSYFSAVNESTWEHLKLVFWPFVAWSIAEYFVWGKNEVDFFAVKMTAVLSAMAFIITFFYTYSGVLGFNLFAADLFTFAAAVFLSSALSYRLMTADTRGDFHDNIKGFVTILLLALCFVLWTENPPDLGLFWG